MAVKTKTIFDGNKNYLFDDKKQLYIFDGKTSSFGGSNLSIYIYVYIYICIYIYIFDGNKNNIFDDQNNYIYIFDGKTTWW